MFQPTTNPALQTIKGIFVFKQWEENDVSQALELLKSISCEVITVSNSRVTVSAMRGKLHEIKECWQSNNSTKLSLALNAQVSKIILGGACRKPKIVQ